MTDAKETTEALLKEQVAYYDARAPEYDEWWERRGRYALDPEQSVAWAAEADDVRRMLDGLLFAGSVVEFAGGTGIWTAYLAKRAHRLLVLDASVPMLKRNQERLAAAGLLPRVRYEQADLFTWKSSTPHDAAFAGFWVSHIPADRLDDFFGRVASAVRPGGVFAILEGQPARARSKLQGTTRVDEELEQRTLNDGSTWRIVKRVMHAEELTERLERAGFATTAKTTANQFLLIVGTRR